MKSTTSLPSAPSKILAATRVPSTFEAYRGATFWVIGHRVTILVEEKDYTYVEIVSPPHLPGPPPHRHADASELFHVLEGKYDVLVEGQTLRLGPGDSVLVPRNGVHSFQNAGRTDARMISVFSPGGFAQFYRDMGFPVELPNAFELSVQPTAIERVVRECGRYEMFLATEKLS